MSAPVILVADRDPLQRQLIDLLLAEDHYVIVGVETGKQALEYVRENTPDLAILDMDLEDINGADVCEKMKSVTRLNTVPVILTTSQRGTGGLDARTKSLAHFVGADLVLQKPLGDKNLRLRAGNLISGEERRAPADDLSLQSTHVIEAAIHSIDDTPAETDSGATVSLQAEGAHYGMEIATLQATIETLKQQLAAATAADGIGRGSRLPLQVQQELDELRARVAEQQQSIDELQLRNEKLVEAIEEEKRKAAAQRGLFGWRRGI